MSKAWSKATEEQRANHRRACLEAGKWRRMFNFVTDVCEKTEKIGIDGIDFLIVCNLLMPDGKPPLDETTGAEMIKLLKQKLSAREVYETLTLQIQGQG